jgi:hypothetical protein
MQIENEYGNIDASYGEAGQRYLNWIANMAMSTNVSVPWIMCQQPEAPQSVVCQLNLQALHSLLRSHFSASFTSFGSHSIDMARFSAQKMKLTSSMEEIKFIRTSLFSLRYTSISRNPANTHNLQFTHLSVV